MLTLKQIYDDKARVIAGLEKKHFAGAAEAINEVLRLDAERKSAQQLKDAAAAEMNKISKSIGALMAQGKRDEAEAAKAQTGALKAQIAEYDVKMSEAEEAQTKLLLTIPNVPYDRPNCCSLFRTYRTISFRKVLRQRITSLLPSVTGPTSR